MSNDNSILLGAVAYDPKVVTIWEGIREHFQNRDHRNFLVDGFQFLMQLPLITVR